MDAIFIDTKRCHLQNILIQILVQINLLHLANALLKLFYHRKIGDFSTHRSVPLIKVGNETYSFNYKDYVSTFYKTFLYENPKLKYTWFIKLCPAALHKGVPTWFYDWWHKYNANLEILPESILKLYSTQLILTQLFII